jgi:hypothetical protein
MTHDIAMLPAIPARRACRSPPMYPTHSCTPTVRNAGVSGAAGGGLVELNPAAEPRRVSQIEAIYGPHHAIVIGD